MTLIGHWVAADAAGAGMTLPDRSAAMRNGTLTAGCSWVTLANGEAAVRCPNTDCVEVIDADAWDLTDFTMIVRYQRNDYSRAGLIAHSPGSGSVPKWIFAWGFGPDDSIALHWFSGGVHTVRSNPFIPVKGLPISIAVKRSGSTITWYAEDVAIGTATDGGGFPTNSEVLRLGWGNETDFDGDVSLVAVRIYDAALSDDDVFAAIRDDAPDAEPPPAPNSQVARWRALEGEDSGTVFPNRINPAFHGTLGEVAEWADVDGCPGVRCFTDGESPPVAGTSDIRWGITLPHEPRWRLSTDFTLIARATWNEADVQESGVLAHNEGPNPGGMYVIPKWVFYMEPTGSPPDHHLVFHWTNGGVGYFMVSSTFAAVDGDTFGVAVKRSGSTFTFYLDGVAIGTDTEATALPDDTVGPLWIGMGGQQDFDDASHDVTVESVRIYNHALDAALIAEAMEADAICAAENACDDDITDVDIISFRWDAGDKGIVNEVIAEFDHDAEADTFTKMLIFHDTESRRKYGPRPPIHIQSKGLRTDLGADDFLEARAREIFSRFGNPCAVVQAEVFYRKHALEAGDIVCLSSAFIPNLIIGGRGIEEEQFEVVDCRPQFADRGKLVLTLLDTEAITVRAVDDIDVSTAEPTGTFVPLTVLGLMGVASSRDEGAFA